MESKKILISGDTFPAPQHQQSNKYSSALILRTGYLPAMTLGKYSHRAADYHGIQQPTAEVVDEDNKVRHRRRDG
jgi:hypothetical protein